MKFGLALICALTLAGCGASEPEPSVYDGAVVVKICADGSRIFRLQDGRFVAGGWGAHLVDNPETVCAQK
jgi:uncharacterized lipoprotein YmbA